MKIAITTTDGKTVDQHFGKANSFHIYEMEHGKLTFVEKRFVQSYCSCVDNEPVKPEHEFSLDRFFLVYEQLKDCKKLYTKQVGDTPKEKLAKNGIDVQLCGCEIASIPTCSGKCK